MSWLFLNFLVIQTMDSFAISYHINFSCLVVHIFLLQEDYPLVSQENWRNILLLHTPISGKKKLNQIRLIRIQQCELYLAFCGYQL